MGFLDHSTNNIIVDAVLTDVGRKALARNDRSFTITQFALGDDEVDYSLIQQYGRTVGKEKIEKNTPILEALTTGNLALKHKLVSVDNEYTTHFPLIELSAGTQTNNFTFSRSSSSGNQSKTFTINLQLATNDGTTIDSQIEDSAFQVEINSLFFEVTDSGSPDIAYSDNTVVYTILESGNIVGDGISTASFTLQVKNFSDTTFNIYKTAGGNSIKTYMKITGINSGLSKSVVLTIS